MSLEEETENEGPDDRAPGGGGEEVTKFDATSRAVLRMVNNVVSDGVGPISGSVAWAEDRLRRVQGPRYQAERRSSRGVEDPPADIERAVSRLIKESVAAAGSAGFVTGLGGFITMPVTVPANLAGALVINARLAGGVAHLRGYDITDPHVQAMIPLVALGSGAQTALAAIGADIGIKLSQQALKKLSIEVIRKINRKVGFMLLAKYGTKRAAVTLVKAIPFAGGIVSGAVDAGLTAAVGKVARRWFDVAESGAPDPVGDQAVGVPGRCAPFGPLAPEPASGRPGAGYAPAR